MSTRTPSSRFGNGPQRAWQRRRHRRGGGGGWMWARGTCVGCESCVAHWAGRRGGSFAWRRTPSSGGVASVQPPGGLPKQAQICFALPFQTFQLSSGESLGPAGRAHPWPSPESDESREARPKPHMYYRDITGAGVNQLKSRLRALLRRVTESQSTLNHVSRLALFESDSTSSRGLTSFTLKPHAHWAP